MRRNFKAQLDRDRKRVFHNSREFAEIREIEYDGDYYKIPVVLDYEAAKDRKKPSSDHAEGIFLVDLVVYIDLDDINRIPRKGNQIAIDGDLYNIVTVENRNGEIVLNLEAFTEFGGRLGMVGITSEQIERVESILNGVQRGPEKVFFNVINRALDTVRTAAGRQIREVYAIKQKDLRAESNIKLKKASQTDLAGEIAFAGCKIPLYRFNVTPKQPAQGVRVKAAVLKSSAQTEFEHAFIARMQSGHVGMFERATAKHLPIDEFTGPSVAHMAGNSVVLEQVEKEAQETIDKRIDHEMDRILSGYGGKS